MLVYGDRVAELDPRAELAALEEALAALPAGLARQTRLVDAFVETGVLAQGLADAERAGRDARTPLAEATMRLLVGLARAIGGGPVPRVATPHGLPATVVGRRPEGYAYYALYPEAYLAAAAGARATHVIGLRSIGTGLAALVAAATGARTPATVRPVGDPFRRELVVAPELLAEWTADPDATFAIADEGPGMSGSSFGAVLDVLETCGVPLERVTCYPSHAGELGPAASERHRVRWRRVRRRVAQLAVPDPAWIAEVVGPVGALVDVSAGRWRAHRYASPAAWPAAVPHQERVKALATAGDGTYLARFAGLGRDGAAAVARARVLAGGGWTPALAGACHGFVVERWYAGTVARPTLDHVARYLAFRARELAGGDGAGRAQLVAMTRRNATLALGPDVAAALDRWEAALPADTAPRRIAVDGRLHAHEWLACADGTTRKADAIDHCAAHDLVGCQDVAWDVAGAACELGLPLGELARRLDADPALCAALVPAYLAFQLGRHAIAIDAVDSDEAARLRAAVDRYALMLRNGLTRDALRSRAR